MKKVVFILLILLLIIFSNKKLFAIQNYDYEENNYSIYFDNLKSSKLNYLLENTDSLIVEIEVNINNKYKSYRFNTLNTKTIERELIKKVISDIKDNETKVYLELNGVKINKIILRCTKDSFNTIIERKNNINV
mgnify:CR=1 FL=1